MRANCFPLAEPKTEVVAYRNRFRPGTSPRDAALLLLLDWRMQMPFARRAEEAKAREVVERFRGEVRCG